MPAHCHHAKNDVGFKTVDVRKLAYDLAVQSNMPHPFNDEKRWQSTTG